MAYIETGNASEAYRRAYNYGTMPPESIHVKACEVMKNVNVALRINQLKQELRERYNVTIDSITIELEEARQLALKTDNPTPAVSASMGKAKLHGLLIDKSELSAGRGIKFTLSIKNDKDN